MSRYPSRVTIYEEGPREGFQIESAEIPTAHKIELIDALSETGLKDIQIVSFVSPKRVPSMADAENLVAGVAMKPGIAYTATYFNERGLERAMATGRLTITPASFSICASPAFLARNERATPEQRRQRRQEMFAYASERGVAMSNEGNVIAAFGCNFQGEITVPMLMQSVHEVHAFAAEHGCRIERLGLSDTMAWATPDKIRRAIDALRTEYPALTLLLHLHDTRGMAMANALAGLEMGVTEFDTSIGGLGGCPFALHKGAAGNLCTEDFVFMCHEMGIETGLDLDRLIDAANLAERIVGHPLPGSVRLGGNLARLRERAALAS